MLYDIIGYEAEKDTADTCSRNQIQTCKEKTMRWANGQYQQEDQHQLTLHETTHNKCMHANWDNALSDKRMRMCAPQMGKWCDKQTN